MRLLLLAAVVAPAFAATLDLRISEFLASNNDGLVDEDGESSDWIEIHNGGSDGVNLFGLHLTDDVGEATQWTFPSFDLAADAYLVVFASSKDRVDPQSELHTNFKLGGGGEYLGLFDSDGKTVLSEYSPEYPPQFEDRSYGIDINGDIRFFATPSPGQANLHGDPDLVVRASVDRGFCDEPFLVALEADGEIRYTLDGSEPTVTSGTTYSTPIAVSTTTVLRAAAFSSAVDFLPSSPTSTYSYIFLGDVIKQPPSIPGFPNDVLIESSQFKQRVPMDFEMDPEVVQEHGEEILDSMAAIPTMSITASLDDIFGDEGVYFGDGVEKSFSMEILDYFNPSENEQIDVGVRGHSHTRSKRSLRLNFRTEYGKREWITDFFRKNSPLNGDSFITDTHRTLVLRSGNNRSWARASNPDRTAYTIDEFTRASQIAMSGVGSHGTFVHLYLNGVYWGVYNLVERPDEQFQAAYFGGDDDDWFFGTHGGPKREDSTRWDYLTGTLADKNMNDPDNYAEMQQYLNVESFADYLLLAFWIGLQDWPHNNWYVANRNDASPLGPTPSVFFAWDGEYALSLLPAIYLLRERKKDGANIRFDFRFDAGSPQFITRLWHTLFSSSEFRALFDERVTKHTSGGGALTAEAALQRWNTLNAYVESAIVGESARWGDSLASRRKKWLAVTRTRDIDWQNEVDFVSDLLQGNTQQFLDEYDSLVHPSLFARAVSKLLELFSLPVSLLRETFPMGP